MKKVLFAALLTLPCSVGAQRLDIQNLQPGFTPNDFIATLSGRPLTPGQTTFSLVGIYANDPLVLVDAAGNELAPLVDHRFDLVLSGAMGLSGGPLQELGLITGLELALSVPFIAYEGHPYEVDQSLNLVATQDSAAGMGDPRLALRIGILDVERFGIDLALIPTLTFPAGDDDGYFGNDSVTFNPEMAASRSLGPVKVAANLGYRVRGNRPLANLNVSDQFTWRMAAGLDLEPFGAPQDTQVSLEAMGQTRGVRPFRNTRQSPVEFLLGARYRFDDLVVGAAFGGGANRGFGAPQWRGLLSLAWAPLTVDESPCAKCNESPPPVCDTCPDCSDAVSQCNTALKEAQQQREELARQLETETSSRELGDRRLQVYRELTALLEKELGDQAPPVAVRKGNMVVQLPNRLLFETGKTAIRPEGAALLSKIAVLLQKIPDRTFLIAGHTDNVPIKSKNIRFRSNWELSTFRGLEVLHFFEKKGVSPKQLAAGGYGEYAPIADNSTEEGRRVNRRTEIIIMPIRTEIPELEDQMLHENDMMVGVQ